MPVEMQQRPLLLWLELLANSARLRHGFGTEAGVGRATEAVGGRAIVKEWRLRSPHSSDCRPWVTTRKGNVDEDWNAIRSS